MKLWEFLRGVLGVWWKRPSATITLNIKRTWGEKQMMTPNDTMILNRTDFADNSTIGDLYMDGNWVCFTLEPTCRKQDGKILAIPQGKYEVVMYDSPRFKMRLPLLIGVENRSYVEIHPGNSTVDTHGCILPGLAKDTDYVLESRAAWEMIVQRVEEKLKAGKFYIGITGGSPTV